jgi:hypothetical protein
MQERLASDPRALECVLGRENKAKWRSVAEGRGGGRWGGWMVGRGGVRGLHMDGNDHRPVCDDGGAR